MTKKTNGNFWPTQYLQHTFGFVTFSENFKVVCIHSQVENRVTALEKQFPGDVTCGEKVLSQDMWAHISGAFLTLPETV